MRSTPPEPWLFWLTAVLVLGAGFGLRDPWPADEPRCALAAVQMVESGQWLFPMRGDEFYSDKPPLLMWLQAIAYAVTGELRIAFLLPSLLASLGTLWLVRDLGRRLWSPEAGACAAWALLFALQFTFQARRAQIDPLLVACTTLAAYGLLRHLLRGPDRRMWMLGWFAAGLGVITKGVGVVALLVLLPAAWAQWRGWPGLVRMRAGTGAFWAGPAMLLLPILAWLVPMLLAVRATGDPALHAYAADILLRQTAERYADPWHHHKPAWYFLAVVATQWLPVMLAVPWAWRHWRDALHGRDARVLLPLAGILLILLFFSLSPGKREVYILPALPLLCLALGPWLPGILARTWPRRLAFGAALAISVAVGAVGLAVWLGTPGFEARSIAERGLDAQVATALGIVFVAIGAWGLASVLWFGRRQPVAALLSTLAGAWVLVGVAATPLLNDSSSSRGLMRDVGRLIGPDAELGLVAWKEQTLLMADRPARTFGFSRPVEAQRRDAIAWQAAAPGGRWLLVEDDALDPCVDRAHAIFAGMAHRRGWWVLPGAATRACAGAAVPDA